VFALLVAVLFSPPTADLFEHSVPVLVGCVLARLLLWDIYRPQLRSKLERKIREYAFEACPNCAYSLRGLPDESACPECGVGYTKWDAMRAWKAFFEGTARGLAPKVPRARK